MNDPVLLDVSDGVATITLNRPDAMNSLDVAAKEALLDAVRSVADDPDEAAFAARFHLVHEWRKFLFTDPGLPRELLPDDWPGRRASDYFRGEADRLAAASEAFVARTLSRV